jgi:hypothetical protein
VRSLAQWLWSWLAGPPVVRVGRNQACPCGSGRKYKRCCLDRDAGLLQEERGRAAAAATNYFGTRSEIAAKAFENANRNRELLK